MGVFCTYELSSADVSVTYEYELVEKEVLLALRLPAVFCSQRMGGLPILSSLSLCWYIFQGAELQCRRLIGN